MPAGMTFDELVPLDEEVGDGIRELCHQLEKAGWMPRRRFGPRGFVFWPDNERGRQLVVDLPYPLNEHKLSFYAEHTGLALTPTTEEH
jgi:hypothetical protein